MMGKNQRRIKLGIVGVGHQGEYYVRAGKNLAGCQLVGVVDMDADRAREIGRCYGVPYYTDYHEILGEIEAVIIATPTSTHYEIGCAFIKQGIHTLVEKPITPTVRSGQRMVDLSRCYKTILQVGHIERFNPALKAVIPEIKNPRFIEAHRLSPFSFRSLDIDVIMDLMIHDIDIVLSLAEGMPKEIYATGVNVFSGRLDIANARLVFPSGLVVNLTASRISDKSMRKMRIFSNDTYASVDFLTHEVKTYRKSKEASWTRDIKDLFDKGTAKDLPAKARLWQGPAGMTKLLQVKELKVAHDDPLQRELASFLDCVRYHQEPEVNGAAGVAALEVAQKIITKIGRHKI